MCITGNAATEIAKEAGIKNGVRLSKTVMSEISSGTFKKVREAVVQKLIVQLGEKRVLELGKVVPLIGGLYGGSVDLFSTIITGEVSKKMFIA